jgi:hypothetical protein
LAPRQSRAYREIFQLVRAEMSNAKADAANTDEPDLDN